MKEPCVKCGGHFEKERMHVVRKPSVFMCNRCHKGDQKIIRTAGLHCTLAVVVICALYLLLA